MKKLMYVYICSFVADKERTVKRMRDAGYNIPSDFDFLFAEQGFLGFGLNQKLLKHEKALGDNKAMFYPVEIPVEYENFHVLGLKKEDVEKWLEGKETFLGMAERIIAKLDKKQQQKSEATKENDTPKKPQTPDTNEEPAKDKTPSSGK